MPADSGRGASGNRNKNYSLVMKGKVESHFAVAADSGQKAHSTRCPKRQHLALIPTRRETVADLLAAYGPSGISSEVSIAIMKDNSVFNLLSRIDRRYRK